MVNLFVLVGHFFKTNWKEIRKFILITDNMTKDSSLKQVIIIMMDN